MEEEKEKKVIPFFSRDRRTYTHKELEEIEQLALASGPWKCKYCNIIFTDRKKAIKHLADTGFRRGGEKGVYFHIVVDRDGDYIIYPKQIHN